MTYSLLLPPGTSEEDARTIITSVSKTAAELGISIVGGHTGWYGGIAQPIVGGVTVWGFAQEGEWISPGGAKDGDVILMTKGPSIEASALLGVLYKNKLEGKLGSDVMQKLLSRVSQITVVEDALTAFRAGGVHAMHDATEGGVLGGLWEISASSGVKIHADFDAAGVPDDIARFAEALGFDPWAAISEGTLLAAVHPDSIPGVRAALKSKGIESFVLGTFAASAKASTVKRDGVTSELAEPGADPFWGLFLAGLS
jgi:hydrogenase maturation factor